MHVKNEVLVPPQKAVYLIHPDHHVDAIAEGTLGVHHRMPKFKLECRMCDIGVQWVYVHAVFVPGILPMYKNIQPHLRVVEDALTDYTDDAWIMWNPDYIFETK